MSETADLPAPACTVRTGGAAAGHHLEHWAAGGRTALDNLVTMSETADLPAPACTVRTGGAAAGRHLEHWAAGGRTALDNLVPPCRHRAVHEEGFRRAQPGGDVTARSR